MTHRIDYGYDGRRLRARRSEPPEAGGNSTRYFIYSPELQLLAITNDDTPNPWLRGPRVSAVSPSIRTEILWFGGRPIAQVTGGTTLAYTFTDHLGTPILRTSVGPMPTATWRAEHEPFGNVYEMRGGNRTDQPLRFPGQEATMTLEGQEENYNIFRWYRSGWGRYTQADPIGLNAGNHLYGYVGGQPVNGRDPLGLYYYHNDVITSHDGVLGSYTVLPSRLGVTYSCGCDISRRGMRLQFDIRVRVEVHISVHHPKTSWRYYCDLAAEYNHVSIFDYYVRRAADAVLPYEAQIYATDNECQAAGRRAWDAMQEQVSSTSNSILHFASQLLEEIRHNGYNPCPFAGTP